MESHTDIPAKKQRLLIENKLLQNAKVTECIREFKLPQTFPSTIKYQKFLSNNITLKNIHMPTSIASSITSPKQNRELITDTKLLKKFQILKLKSPDGRHLDEFDVQLLSQVDNNINAVNNTMNINGEIVNMISDLDKPKSDMPKMKILPPSITDITQIVNNSLKSSMRHSKSSSSLITNANQGKPTHKILIQPLTSNRQTNVNVNQLQLQSTSNNLEGNKMYIVRPAKNWEIVQFNKGKKQGISTLVSTPKMMKFPRNNEIEINSLKISQKKTSNNQNFVLNKPSSFKTVKTSRLQRRKSGNDITDKLKQPIIDRTNDVHTAKLSGIKRPLNIPFTDSLAEGDKQSNNVMDSDSSGINTGNVNGNNNSSRNVVSSVLSDEIGSRFNCDEKNIVMSRRSYPLRNSQGTVNLIRRGKKLITNTNKSISDKVNINPTTSSKRLTPSANSLTNLRNNKNENNLSKKDMSNNLSIVGQALNMVNDDELRKKALQALADCGIGVECLVPDKPPLDKMSIKESQTQTCVFGLLDQNNFLRVIGDTDNLSRLKVIDRYTFANMNVSTNTSIQETQKFTKKINKILNQRWVNKANVEQIKEILKVNPIVEKAYNLVEKDFKNAKKYDENGLLSIHRAILSDQPSAVKRQMMVLQSCKQSIDIPTTNRETGLELAIKYSVSSEIISMLLKAGANPISHELAHDSALTIAANKSPCFLSELIKYVTSSGDLNYHDSEGMTALHYCVMNKNNVGLLALIEANADVNVRDLKSGKTPLFQALQNEHLDIAEELLKNGAEANIQNFSGQTVFTLLDDVKHYSLKEALFKSIK